MFASIILFCLNSTGVVAQKSSYDYSFVHSILDRHLKSYNNAMDQALQNCQRKSNEALNSNNRQLWVLNMFGQDLAYFKNISDLNAAKNSFKGVMEKFVSACMRDIVSEAERISGSKAPASFNSQLRSIRQMVEQKMNPEMRQRQVMNPNYVEHESTGNDLRDGTGSLKNKYIGENSKVQSYSNDYMSHRDEILGIYKDTKNPFEGVYSTKPKKEIYISAKKSKKEMIYAAKTLDTKDMRLYQTDKKADRKFVEQMKINQQIEDLEKDKKRILAETDKYRESLNSFSDVELIMVENEMSKMAEASLLAEHVYGYSDRVFLPKGWCEVRDPNLKRKIDAINSLTSIKTDLENLVETGINPVTGPVDVLNTAVEAVGGIGFNCMLYQNEKGEYALVFRGTDAPTLENYLSLKNNPIFDYIEDANGAVHVSSQTRKAIKIIDELLESGEINKSNLTLIGHSLGGRTTAESSIKSSISACTFNAAGTSIQTKMELISSPLKANNTLKIVDVHANSEFLENLQSLLPGFDNNGQYVKIKEGQNEHDIVSMRETLYDRLQCIYAEKNRRKLGLKENIPISVKAIEHLNSQKRELEYKLKKLQ